MSNARSTALKAIKRKSDASAPGSAKKSKSSAPDSHAAARALVATVLAAPESHELPVDDEDALRQLFVSLARYARSLEAEVESASHEKAVQAKSPKQIEDEATRLANTINSGIKKQMSWKPSCKTNSAKFSFDGFCPDPAAFGALLNLEGPPTFKAKKFTKDEMEEFIGDVRGSVRYDTLHITSAVNVRWNPDTGEFKFSGSYGRGY